MEEAVNFEELRHHLRLEATSYVRQAPHELRIYGNNNNNNIYGLPNVVLQFNFVIHQEVWRKPPDNPSQLVYIPESQRYETKSLHLKVCPSQYMSYDVFYNVLEENLNNWGDYSEDYNDILISRMITRIYKFVDAELNNGGGGTNCQNVELLVDMNVKLECILDGRLEGMPSRGMVPASKASIMQLPERMEIDEDQSLNDHDCVICLEQLGKEGAKIVCMPCPHMFHGDCITTWLDKSHYCPICRYDMPTTTT